MAQTRLPVGDNIRVTVSAMTEPYWLGTRERKLLAARCSDCGSFRMPFLAFCPSCTSQAVTWVELGQRATIYSFTFYPHPARTGADDSTMLAPAVVEFAEAPGIRYSGDIFDIDSADIRIGMTVEIDWVFNAEGWGFLGFRPVAGA